MSYPSINKKQPIRVLISGAAGQIGYSLVPLVANGDMLGKDQKVILHLFDIEPAQKMLRGLVMELEDCAYPLVHSIVASTELSVAFKDVDICILAGGFPRKKGMTRGDLLAKNSSIFIGQGKAIDQYANRSVKVVVVANPANTNCYITMKNAPSIDPQNFSALTRLDQNRAMGQLGNRLGTPADTLANVIVWGNHSLDQYPDHKQALVLTSDGRVVSLENNPALPKEWLADTFRPTVQSRGKAVIMQRGLSSALSAANAAKDHIRDWVLGTRQGEYVSMAVISNGEYGVAKGIFFSFPCTCRNGQWRIVEGLELSKERKEALERNSRALLLEREQAEKGEAAWFAKFKEQRNEMLVRNSQRTKPDHAVEIEKIRAKF